MNKALIQDTFPIKTYQISFSIAKKVKYGQAIYVCGNIKELGMWNPEKSLRLRWTEVNYLIMKGDLWTQTMKLSSMNQETIEYKFVIADYHNPSQLSVQWQAGKHNRKIALSSQTSSIKCNEKWNIDKISIILKTSLKQKSEKYCILGDIYELGSWKQYKTMTKIDKVSSVFNAKQNVRMIQQKDTIKQNKEVMFAFHFEMYRGRQQFSYCFIKNGLTQNQQEKKIRSFRFENLNSKCNVMSARYYQNHLLIFNCQREKQLIYSKITDKIYVGSYPKSADDIKKLKSQGVTAILSIQSERDFLKHGIGSHYISLLCKQNCIKYSSYSIQDMNAQEFINKSEGAVELLNEFQKKNQVVYIHCSAGKFRSPMVIALHFVLHKKMQLQTACNLLESQHYLARPNHQLIGQALKKISLRKQFSRVYT